MQRFKKEMLKRTADSGNANGLRDRQPHPAMDMRNKFVYGANGTLCQYARWRNAQIEGLNGSALHRYLRKEDGHRSHVLDAHFCIGHAGVLRALSTLVFARLSDAR